MFGKVYENTYWGIGSNNNNGWGNVFRKYVDIDIDKINTFWNKLTINFK